MCKYTLINPLNLPAWQDGPSFALRVSERMFFTACFARDPSTISRSYGAGAESAKRNYFSISVDPREIGFAIHGAGRTAMENHSAPLECGSDGVIQCLMSPVQLQLRSSSNNGCFFLLCALLARALSGAQRKAKNRSGSAYSLRGVGPLRAGGRAFAVRHR